ncbi:MAG: YncE family protein [Thermomicrobiales bacterium]
MIASESRWTVLRRAILTPPGRVLAVSLLVIALAAPAASLPASPIPPGEVGFELYVSIGIEHPSGQALTPLDPLTLQDDRDAPVIDLGRLPSPWHALHEQRSATWVAAGDGSVFVGIEQPPAPLEERGMTIVVRDGWTGEERLRFQPGVPIERYAAPLVSADGSRVVVEGSYEALQAERNARHNGFGASSRRAARLWDELRSPQDMPPPVMIRWHVFDTATGRLVSTNNAAGPFAFGRWLDPAGTRLYYLSGPILRGYPSVTGWRESAGEPAPARIVAHDLATGEEVGRLELAGVPVGAWETAEHRIAAAEPGVALSPDGARLAVVHPDLSALTLIDAPRLRVERTVAIERPASLADRLLGLLPLMPRDAAAKGPAEGVYLHAVFSPDGARLYVAGREIERGEGGYASRSRGLGLRVIDVASGNVVASAFSEAEIGEILPAPDGRTVYVVRNELFASQRWLLQRLDVVTLEVLAEREFDGYPWFLMRSQAASAATT